MEVKHKYFQRIFIRKHREAVAVTQTWQWKMPTPDKEAFVKVWPRCFLIFLAIIELLAALVLIATELGNVAANFWITNVFAGGWCGVIMLIHFVALCAVGKILKRKTRMYSSIDRMLRQNPHRRIYYGDHHDRCSRFQRGSALLRCGVHCSTIDMYINTLMQQQCQ